MEADWRRHDGIERTFVIASAHASEAAARAAAEAPAPIDLVLASPTGLARQAAEAAVGDRAVMMIEEPLLAPRAPGETGADVVARVAQALRGVHAYEANTPLVICDGLDVLGAEVFVLDEKGVMRAADALEELLPLP